VDFGVVQETVGVTAFAEVTVTLVVEDALVDGLEETAHIELDPIGRLRGAGERANSQQGRGTQKNFLHLEIP